MNSCLYHSLMFVAVVLSAPLAVSLIKSLIGKINEARYFVKQIKVPPLFAQVVFAMSFTMFITARVIPKHIKVFDCGSGERIEKIAIKTNMSCKVKPS